MKSPAPLADIGTRAIFVTIYQVFGVMRFCFFVFSLISRFTTSKNAEKEMYIINGTLNIEI